MDGFVCKGPDVFSSMVPAELFYMTSLAVYGFFVFFAFFIYQRRHFNRSGAVGALAMLFLSAYVGSTLLVYDMATPSSHLIAWGIGWWGANLSVAGWLHMTLLLEAEDRPGGSGKLRRGQLAIIAAAYASAITFAVSGTLLPNTLSGWLFDYEKFGFAPWPYCLWTHFWTAPGPYYFLFGLYVMLTVLYLLIQLTRLATRAHKEAVKETAGTANALSLRNKYLWLFAATVILLAAGVLLVFMVDLGWALPESVGHILLAAGGLIVGLVIVRHNAFVSESNVAPDFYRAASSTGALCTAVVISTYLAEGPTVNKTTLVALVTLTIIFFSSVDRWRHFIDNLFLGPHAASERARIRSALADTAHDPVLLRLRLVYQAWSPETQRVFLHLGEGLSRSSIASSEEMHISTVDVHIRRIKDALAQERLEEIRALAHRLLILERLAAEPAAGRLGGEN